ncbi:dihydrolipoamide acetyltransferase family protein [Rhizobium mesoamericanum]|uniref:Dihydrolipoamide acetyltransferase component of pyruvate dehydrogenase complex n=1 Tax=Rhizobium mesoamericanum STM3625 TaxID=1211777 RepID=K0Q654_9HYPH|nr:dihydrolipoamide acetyltransferase family protein [Rhizobium mesoamericanum]CCM79264.1 Lipoamide acyltransferase component of branched-chain alpha-keto acid dehydrogenase complex [Rhizobium mesoamericanum STM3625]
MGEFIIKMPDVGEGVAEAELVEWHVKAGDPVKEDMVIAAVMTDKATVEIPSPVTGTVIWLGAEIGDKIAVKAPLVRIETSGGEANNQVVEAPPAKAPANALDGPPATLEPEIAPATKTVNVQRPEAPVPAEKPLASPSVRLFARENGVDLRQLKGSGPAGRILREDVEQFIARGDKPSLRPAIEKKTSTEEVKLTGLRRRIAEKMSLSTSRIPHITYVEEVDVTALEELRATMNRDRKPEQPKLTILPFLMRTIVKAVAEQPNVNATFDDERGILTRHGAVHIGIATQTPAGLVVPVVKNAEARGIWECAAELNRLAEAARTGTATRDELGGSTITVSSLGALGGIVSTPVINHPEVAIVGVNKIAVRPAFDGTQFVPRKMMNLSSSFDHRIIDGWDAATFVQRVRVLLETPALIFIEG